MPADADQLLNEIAGLLAQDKELLIENVSWASRSRTGFDQLEFAAPVGVGGVIRHGLQHGLQARITCRSDLPEEDFHAQLKLYAPALAAEGRDPPLRGQRQALRAAPKCVLHRRCARRKLGPRLVGGPAPLSPGDLGVVWRASAVAMKAEIMRRPCRPAGRTSPQTHSRFQTNVLAKSRFIAEADMEPLSAITAALIAGATAAASETASQAVKDAYQALKKVLIDGYKIGSTALLEKKPSSPVYRQAFEDELKENAAVADDRAVLEKTKAVQEALLNELPAQLAVWGIDIKKLEAGGSLIVERIAGGIHGDEWKAEKDIHLSDISGGKSRLGKT
jgi:hypothetical protein